MKDIIETTATRVEATSPEIKLRTTENLFDITTENIHPSTDYTQQINLRTTQNIFNYTIDFTPDIDIRTTEDVFDFTTPFQPPTTVEMIDPEKTTEPVNIATTNGPDVEFTTLEEEEGTTVGDVDEETTRPDVRPQVRSAPSKKKKKKKKKHALSALVATRYYILPCGYLKE